MGTAVSIFFCPEDGGILFLETLVNIYELHGVISQNAVIFKVTAVKTSNLTRYIGDKFTIC
jgi:hypothetical protein